MIQKQKGSLLLIMLFVFLIIFLIGGWLFIKRNKNASLISPKNNQKILPSAGTKEEEQATTSENLNQQINKLDSQLKDVDSSLNDQAIDVNQE